MAVKSAVVFFFDDREPVLPSWRGNKATLDNYVPSEPTPWSVGVEKWRRQALREVPHLIAMIYISGTTGGEVDSDGAITEIPEAELAGWVWKLTAAYHERNGLGEVPGDGDIAAAASALGLGANGSGRPQVGSPKRDGFRAVATIKAKIIEQREDRLLRRYAEKHKVDLYVRATYPSGREVEFDGVECCPDGQGIIEAKADATALSVRTAIGQLHDYLQIFRGAKPPMILLPDRPGDDLVRLVRGLGFTLCCEAESGEFERLDPTGPLHEFVRAVAPSQ